MPKYDQVYLQRSVITYVAERLPQDEVYSPKPGSGNLERLLVTEAKAEYISHPTHLLPDQT